MTKIFIALLFLSISQISCSADENDKVVHLSQEETLAKLAKDKNNTILLDVRSTREFSNGHIPNAVNIPHDEILDNVSLLDEYKDKDIIVYCRSGYRAGKVNDLLSESREGLYHLKGDYRKWQANGLEIIKE